MSSSAIGVTALSLLCTPAERSVSGTPLTGVAYLASSATCAAIETGLLASEVLSTFPSPTSVLKSVTTPVLPATLSTAPLAVLSFVCTAVESLASVILASRTFKAVTELSTGVR